MTTGTSATLEDYATTVAAQVGGTAHVAFDAIKVKVSYDRWVEAIAAAKAAGLVFFSWLSAIDWANEVAVGEPLAEAVEDRFEVLCTLADLSEGRRVTFSTDVDKAKPRLPTLVGVFPGADWHEREAREMFGIEFIGHPHPGHLYLPDGFEGHPLRKSFRLLARDVKPWPGMVDVEGMPGEEPGETSTENPEA